MNLPPTNAFVWENFDWHSTGAIRSNKVWIWTSTGKPWFHRLLYDLDSSRIVGDVTNGTGLFFNGDGTKLLCEAWENAPIVALRESIERSLEKWHIHVPQTSAESYWIVNVSNQTAQFIGRIDQDYHSVSEWISSPSGRYGFTSMRSGEARKFHICDLETETLLVATCRGHPVGWWSDHQIIVSEGSNNYALYNVASGETTNLFTSRQFQDILLANGIRPPEIAAIPNWNGTDYDFYFACENDRYTGANSFLLKADRTTRTLKMVDLHFQFRWLGHLDAQAQFYVYPGEKGKWGQGGNGAMYLRNLKDSSVQTLLQSNNSGQYVLGQFFDGGVVYSKNRHMYRIDLNGSNNVPLFGKRN